MQNINFIDCSYEKDSLLRNIVTRSLMSCRRRDEEFQQVHYEDTDLKVYNFYMGWNLADTQNTLLSR